MPAEFEILHLELSCQLGEVFLQGEKVINLSISPGVHQSYYQLGIHLIVKPAFGLIPLSLKNQLEAVLFQYHSRSDFLLLPRLSQYLHITKVGIVEIVPGYSQNANPFGLLVSWSKMSLQ